MIEKPMYRTQIVDQPEWEEYLAWDRREGELSKEWWHRPVGWEASPDYIERYETNKFFEPRTERWYKSRSSAAARAALLNSMGYVAIVQQSAPVLWPADGQKKIDNSEARQITAAIRVLKRAGLITSADELFGLEPTAGRR